MSVGNLGPYEALGNAVVIQAVKDYREAEHKLSRGKKNTIAESTKQECERFFQSPYFNVFTQLDGKALLSQLEKEVAA